MSDPAPYTREELQHLWLKLYENANAQWNERNIDYPPSPAHALNLAVTALCELIAENNKKVYSDFKHLMDQQKA